MVVQNVRTARSDKGQRTKSAILDAAEREFSCRGFDGVSMRQVADAANQLVGVLTYHFPTKDELFEAVVTRRAEEISALREAALDGLAMPTLENLLGAFLKPFLDRIEHGDAGWRYYARILAHISQEDRWASLVNRLFGLSALRFIRMMREAEPALRIDDAARAYVHLIAVMVGLFASTGLLDRLSLGRLSSEDIAANLDPAIRFAAGGIRLMASSSAT